MKKVGRPKSFDPDEALDAALRVFWAKGYEGASLADLTEAMGINRPSLYAEFGNKEALFRRAYQRYADDSKTRGDAFGHQSAREAYESFLRATAEGAAHPEHPGCLFVTSALVGGDVAESVRRMLCEARQCLVDDWRARFYRARDEGELPPDVDPAALARYVMTVANGLSVAATGGATAEELRAVAEIAIRAWPA